MSQYRRGLSAQGRYKWTLNKNQDSDDDTSKVVGYKNDINETANAH